MFVFRDTNGSEMISVGRMVRVLVDQGVSLSRGGGYAIDNHLKCG